MKKVLLMSICLLFLANGLFAIGVGVFGGLNTSNSSNLDAAEGTSLTGGGVALDIDSVDPDTSLRSFLLGGYIELGLPVPFLSIRPELVYVQKGFNLNYAGEALTAFGLLDTRIDSKFEYKFIELPLLLQFSTELGGFRPFLLAGPVFSYFLGGTGTVVVAFPGTGAAPVSTPADLEAGNAFPSFSVGLLVGGGIAYKIIPLIEVFASIRYQFGFIDLSGPLAGLQEFREIHILGGLSFNL